MTGWINPERETAAILARLRFRTDSSKIHERCRTSSAT